MMKSIAVASPVHGQAGNTTVALIMAKLLADKGKRVCLTHLSARSGAFFSYLGLDRLEDKTRTPSQVAKLILAGALEKSAITDYCITAGNIDVFSNNSESLTNEDMERVQNFLYDSGAFDVLIVDIDVNLDTPTAKIALERSDLLCVTLTQSRNVLERYRASKLNDYVLKGLFICNHFSPDVGSLPGFAKAYGIPNKSCVEFSNSASLMKYSNDGMLGELRAFAEKKVPTLKADLDRLSARLTARLTAKGDDKT